MPSYARFAKVGGPSGFEFVVEADEARRLLRNLADERERGKAIRRSLEASGRVGLMRLKPRFDKSAFPTSKTGNLSRSVKARVYVGRRTGTTGVMVGPLRPLGQHRHLVEYGHRMVGHEPTKGYRGHQARPNPRVTPVRGSVQSAMEATFIPALEQWVGRLATEGR